jgi:uncharacterized RDD family membrane protein YckC
MRLLRQSVQIELVIEMIGEIYHDLLDAAGVVGAGGGFHSVSSGAKHATAHLNWIAKFRMGWVEHICGSHSGTLHLMTPPQPASIVQRIFAFLWDCLPIMGWLLLVTALGVTLGIVAPDAAKSVFGNPLTGQLAGFLLVTLPVTLYFAVQESSSHHATWGKRKRGLVVVNLLGDGIGFPQALARTLLKFLPWELSHTFIIHASIADRAGLEPPDWAMALMVLAYLLVMANVVSFFMSRRRQMLYDRIAATQVMRAAE